jgi:hypothetical protein
VVIAAVAATATTVVATKAIVTVTVALVKIRSSNSSSATKSLPTSDKEDVSPKLKKQTIRGKRDNRSRRAPIVAAAPVQVTETVKVSRIETKAVRGKIPRVKTAVQTRPTLRLLSSNPVHPEKRLPAHQRERINHAANVSLRRTEQQRTSL